MSQRIVIHYCIERGLTPVQTEREIETIEQHEHVSGTLVYTWHERFKDGWSGDPMIKKRVSFSP